MKDTYKLIDKHRTEFEDRSTLKLIVEFVNNDLNRLFEYKHMYQYTPMFQDINTLENIIKKENDLSTNK